MERQDEAGEGRRPLRKRTVALWLVAGIVFVFICGIAGALLLSRMPSWVPSMFSVPTREEILEGL